MPLDFSSAPVAPAAPAAASSPTDQPVIPVAKGPATPFSALPAQPKWSEDPGERFQQIGPLLKFDGSADDDDLQNQWHDAYSQYVQQNGLPRRTMIMMGHVGLPGMAKGVMQSIAAPAAGAWNAFSKGSNELWTGHLIKAAETAGGAVEGAAAGVGDALKFAGDVGMGTAEAGLSAFGKGNPAVADYAAESALQKMKIDKKYNDLITGLGQKYSLDPESFEGVRPVGQLLAAGGTIGEAESGAGLLGRASSKLGEGGVAAVETAKGLYAGAEKLPGIGYAFRVLRGAGNKLAEGAEATEENPYMQVGKGLVATGPKAVKNMIGGGTLAGAASNPGDDDPVGQGIAAALGYTAAAELPELAQNVYNTPLVQGAADAVRAGIKSGFYAPADAVNAVRAKIGGAVLRAQTLRQEAASQGWSNKPVPPEAQPVSEANPLAAKAIEGAPAQAQLPAAPTLHDAAVQELPRAEVPLVPASHLVGPDSQVFSSPNATVDQMTFEQAKAALAGKPQADYEAFLKKNAPEGAEVHGALGDWVDGAENSVVTSFKKAPPDTELEQYAAKAGLTNDPNTTQKSVLIVKQNPNGQDMMHHMLWDDASPDDVRKVLDEAGIQYKTIVPTEKGTLAHVFDQGNSNRPAISRVLESDDGPDEHVAVRAGGKFIGDPEFSSRDVARANYQALLDAAEKARNQNNDAGAKGAGDVRQALPFVAAPSPAAGPVAGEAAAVPQGNAGAQAQVGPSGESAGAAPVVAAPNAPAAAPGGEGVSSAAAPKATYNPSNRPEAPAPGTPPTPVRGVSPEDQPIVRHAVFDFLLRGVRAGSKSAGDHPFPAPVEVSDLKPGDTFSALGRAFKVFPSSEPNQIVIHYPEGDFDFAVNKDQVIYPDPDSINQPIEPMVAHNPGTNVTHYGLNLGGTEGMTVRNKPAAVREGESPAKNNPYLYPSGNLRNLWEMGTAPTAASYANRTFGLPSKRGEVAYAQHTNPLAAPPFKYPPNPIAAPLAAKAQ